MPIEEKVMKLETKVITKEILADLDAAYPEPRPVRVTNLFNRMRLEIIQREAAKRLALKGRG